MKKRFKLIFILVQLSEMHVVGKVYNELTIKISKSSTILEVLLFEILLVLHTSMPLGV